MLHPQILNDLLDDELDAARTRLGSRVEGVRHDGRYVWCPLPEASGEPRFLRLDGAHYDTEPLRVAVCGGDEVQVGAEGWPAGLLHSVHPVLQQPFACVRGTWEYHMFPGHHQDRWDVHRARLRLADLLDHLLRKVGR